MHTLQLPLGQVLVHRIPVVDTLPLLEVHVVDVVEALVPCLKPTCRELDNVLAEAAPEAVLPVASDPPLTELFPDVLLVWNTVVATQMRLEGIAAEEDLGAGADLARRESLVAAPSLELVVLRVFVALPVVLATEGFVADCVCAAPRS